MKRIGVVIGFIAIAIAGFMASGSSAVVTQLVTNEDKITICHASGLAGTIKYETLTISRNAVFGPGGHFNENGTPQAGHEQDYMGPCITETTTTTTTDTTTTTPRGVATAGAICIQALGQYRVFGTIDGQVASVSPDTIPGGRNGPTLVTVTLGADSQVVIVNTAGDCVQSDTTTDTTTTTTTTTDTTTTTGTTTDTTTTTLPPNDSTTISTTTDTTTTTAEETTTAQPPTVKPPKPNKPNKPKTTQKKHKQGKPKMPPLCPVGVTAANSPNEPCAVQGSG